MQEAEQRMEQLPRNLKQDPSLSFGMTRDAARCGETLL